MNDFSLFSLLALIASKLWLNCLTAQMANIPFQIPKHTTLNDLQEFVESFCKVEACRDVDLREIAGGARLQGSCLSVVLDVDGFLIRLYGGFYADWIGGGQWTNVIEYLTNLIRNCRDCGLNVVAFFNGAVDGSRFTEWCEKRAAECSNVRNIALHIMNKATPPPKLWWIAPTFLTTSIRLAFISLGVPMVTSIVDHRMELVSYCRENRVTGVIGNSAEYLIFGQIRYFSADKFKLKFSGSMLTEEYLAEGLARKLNCHPQRFCVLAALLGWLFDFASCYILQCAVLQNRKKT